MACYLWQRNRALDDTVRHLAVLCALFAKQTGRSVSTVSRRATGSGDTIARLRSGGAITTRRAERALRFLSENWPEPVEWPTHIPRPASARTLKGAARAPRKARAGRAIQRSG